MVSVVPLVGQNRSIGHSNPLAFSEGCDSGLALIVGKAPSPAEAPGKKLDIVLTTRLVTGGGTFRRAEPTLQEVRTANGSAGPTGPNRVVSLSEPLFASLAS